MADARAYNFKQPRRLNVVTILFIVGGLFATYCGMKFFPVYWKRYKVDRALAEGQNLGSNMYRLEGHNQKRLAGEVVEKTTERIEALGLSAEEHGLTVYFDDDYETLHADYTVVVTHPAGSPSTFEMHRAVDMATEGTGL